MKTLHVLMFAAFLGMAHTGTAGDTGGGIKNCRKQAALRLMDQDSIYSPSKSTSHRRDSRGTEYRKPNSKN